MERFCRLAARGGSLAEAARGAGYAPASARQRASELWARDDVQHRIADLRAELEDEDEADLKAIRDDAQHACDAAMKDRKFTTVARLLAQLYRMHRDAITDRGRSRAERERLREEMREEMRDDIAEELREEMRDRIAEEMRAELRARPPQPAPHPEPPAPPRTMSNHDVDAAIAPEAAAEPAVPGRADPPAPPRNMTNHDVRPGSAPSRAAVPAAYTMAQIDALAASGEPITDEQQAAIRAGLEAEFGDLETALLEDRPMTPLQDMFVRLLA
jgi:phage terminase small subunit